MMAKPFSGCSRAGRPALVATLAALTPFLPPRVHAQALATEKVVISATRVATPAIDVPASIDSLDGAQVRDGRLQVNISESLGGVAGLQARDRQNYAQDVQVSVRGFGARSTFGIRGVRLYVDGVPATLPDGQGQLSNVDLGSVARIEVLRGPFSVLYGNSSGGVIQVFSEDGSGPPTLSPALAAGSDNVRRAGLKVSGSQGSFGYLASVSEFETDGYRRHSAARRQLANIKLNWAPGADSRFSLVANSVALPLAQDPLGLTRAQFNADPRAVDPSADTFDTRKTVAQSQFGLTGEQQLGAGRLQALVYAGHRSTEQFQSIPVATQASALHPGGVIQLGRDYRGADVRWSLLTTARGLPLSIVVGVAHDGLDETRVGRQNFIGSALGVEGALRRDESNRVRSLDEYLQVNWQPLPALKVSAGVRHSDIRFVSTDRYIVGINPDDSGAVDFGATVPAVGVLYAFDSGLRAYATAGRGFETPTLNELAYRSDGKTGLNLALQASRSDNVEVGLKWRTAQWGEFKLALFDIRTRHEIVTVSNVGGRSTFTNAGATGRRGAEASWAAAVGADVEVNAAYTLIDARYRDGFSTCATAPCAAPNLVVAAGNRIPGVARQTGYAGIGWLPAVGWRAGVELRASSRVYVNDVNSDAAGGYATVGAHLGYRLKFDRAELTWFGRVDNAFARRYAGSVIVNEGNSRYFEPAPGRTWLAGVSGTVAF